MELQCRNSDRISSLPQNTIEKILTLMPIRDAVRSSILSRKWRHRWTSILILEFNDNMLKVSCHDELNKLKLVSAIFHVLLLHRGPILKFNISIYTLEIGNELDQMILHLSRSNNDLKEIILDFWSILTSFFSLQRLKCIDLSHCAIELPLMFKGFSMLRSLSFFDVEITAITFQRFVIGCPLLEAVTLIGYKKGFIGEGKCTYFEFSKCLPLIQYLEICNLYIEHFVAGPPGSLVHLKILVLKVCFVKQDELLSALWLISSSPNLLKIKMLCMDHNVQRTSNIPFDLHHSLNLDHLREVEITSFHNYAPEMEFVKLIMAKSCKLKQVRLELNRKVSVDEEVKMLRYLLRGPFPPAASIIVERP